VRHFCFFTYIRRFPIGAPGRAAREWTRWVTIAIPLTPRAESLQDRTRRARVVKHPLSRYAYWLINRSLRPASSLSRLTLLPRGKTGWFPSKTRRISLAWNWQVWESPLSVPLSTTQFSKVALQLFRH